MASSLRPNGVMVETEGKLRESELELVVAARRGLTNVDVDPELESLLSSAAPAPPTLEWCCFAKTES